MLNISEANYRLTFGWPSTRLEEAPRTDWRTDKVLPGGAPDRAKKPGLEMQIKQMCGSAWFVKYLQWVASSVQEDQRQCWMCRKSAQKIIQRQPLVDANIWHLCVDGASIASNQNL